MCKSSHGDAYHNVTSHLVSLQGIEHYDDAVRRAKDWFVSSYPDWGDSVSVVHEQTGDHACSYRLQLLFSDATGTTEKRP